jgi:hypothetical protein
VAWPSKEETALTDWDRMELPFPARPGAAKLDSVSMSTEVSGRWESKSNLNFLKLSWSDSELPDFSWDNVPKRGKMH